MPRLPSWIFPVTGLVLIFGVALSRADFSSTDTASNTPEQTYTEQSDEDGRNANPVAADSDRTSDFGMAWSRHQDSTTRDAQEYRHGRGSESERDHGTAWSHGHDGSTRNAQEHWSKHGRDFPQYHSAEDYEHGAQSFTHDPPPGTRIKHRSNGDTLLYNPETNTFAVEDKNGKPRTYFRPDNGPAYWDRQHER